MTQREEQNKWDEYQAYIRSGGQNPVIRETFLINHITALTLRLQEVEQLWCKFDKDDETTWPENGRYWVALRNGDVSDDEFQAERTSQYRIWNAFDPRYVTHWQEVVCPFPPTEGEE